MTRINGCHSCGLLSVYEQRVRCSRCDDQVHKDCRDVQGICYQCRWRQARRNGISGHMLTPSSAGRAPFEDNPPVTLARGLRVPLLPCTAEHPGYSANALRIMTAALWAGWHVNAWAPYGPRWIELHKRFEFSPDGLDDLYTVQVRFTVTGQVVGFKRYTGSHGKGDPQPNTAVVLEHLGE